MMDVLDEDFQNEIRSLAPDLIFAADDVIIKVDEFVASAVPSVSASPSSVDNPPSPVQCQQLSRCDRESILELVFSDHPYSKPYGTKSEVKSNDVLPSPTRVLKLFNADSATGFSDQGGQQSDGEDDIDITSVNESQEHLVTYDVSRAQSAMEDVETYLNSLWNDVDKDDEEKFTRGSWSRDQAKLFDATYRIINNYQLAKLAYKQNSNEPVLRKLALDKATKRLRKTLGTFLWNSKLVVWLHGVMIDGLGSSLFLCYLEILQSLKRMVPSLIEKTLLFDRVAKEKEVSAGLPNLLSNLKKSWDPSIGLQTKVLFDPLKLTPYLIIIPSGPNIPHQSTKRNRVWNNQLIRFGKTVTISVPAYRTPEGYVIKHYLEHCISATRSRMKEFQSRCPSRPRVLIGWGVGSLISFKVGLLTKVDAIICLGFPCNGLNDQLNEDYWEKFGHIEAPVLFIIGTHAVTNSQEKIEKLRHKIRAKTSLVLVENADEMLRIAKAQKRMLGMTQSMIDKLIQDEIFLFLKEVLFRPKIQLINSSRSLSPKKKKKKVEEDVVKKKSKKTSQLFSTKPVNLPPLGVEVPFARKTDAISQGLLTTKRHNSPGTMTSQNPHEYLNNATFRLQQTDLKIGQKRPAAAERNQKKPKAMKKTFGNKLLGNFMPGHTFSANLGVKKAGNLFSQRFSPLSEHPVASSRSSSVKTSSPDHRTNPYFQQMSGSPISNKPPPVSSNSNIFPAFLPNSAVTSATNSSPYTIPFQLKDSVVVLSDSPTINPDNVVDTEADYVASLLEDTNSTLKDANTGVTNIGSSPVISTSTLLSTFERIMNNPSSDAIKQIPHSDIRYLAALLSKQPRSQPSSPTMTRTKNFSQQANFAKPSDSKLKNEGMTSDFLSQERKIAILKSAQTGKKMGYPLTAPQKVAILKSKDSQAPISSPRLKTTRVVAASVSHVKGLETSRTMTVSSTDGMVNHWRSPGSTSSNLKEPKHSVNLTSYLAKQRILLSNSISSSKSLTLINDVNKDRSVGNVNKPGSPSAYLINKLVCMGTSPISHIDHSLPGESTENEVIQKLQSNSLANVARNVDLISKSVLRIGSPIGNNENEKSLPNPIGETNDELITPRTRVDLFSPKSPSDAASASLFSSFPGKSAAEGLFAENTADVDFNISSLPSGSSSRKLSIESTSKQILEATKLLSSSNRLNDSSQVAKSASIKSVYEPVKAGRIHTEYPATSYKSNAGDDSKIKTIFVARPSFIRGGVTSPAIKPALISASLKMNTPTTSSSQSRIGKAVDHINLFSPGNPLQRSAIAEKLASIVPLRKLRDSKRHVKSTKESSAKQVLPERSLAKSGTPSVPTTISSDVTNKNLGAIAVTSPQKEYTKKGRVLRPRVSVEKISSPWKRVRTKSSTSSDDDHLIKISKPTNITFAPQQKSKTINDFIDAAQSAVKMDIELTNNNTKDCQQQEYPPEFNMNNADLTTAATAVTTDLIKGPAIQDCDVVDAEETITQNGASLVIEKIEESTCLDDSDGTLVSAVSSNTEAR